MARIHYEIEMKRLKQYNGDSRLIVYTSQMFHEIVFQDKRNSLTKKKSFDPHLVLKLSINPFSNGKKIYNKFAKQQDGSTWSIKKNLKFYYFYLSKTRLSFK